MNNQFQEHKIVKSTKYPAPITRRGYKDKATLTVTAELEYLRGNDGAYFAITAEETSLRGGWSGGCQHDLVSRHFPSLTPYIKWHLCSLQSGPMYYLANALFHHSELNPGYLKRHIVYGAVEGDTDTDPMQLAPHELYDWLVVRFPALMEAFYADMAKLFPDFDSSNLAPAMDACQRPATAQQKTCPVCGEDTGDDADEHDHGDMITCPWCGATLVSYEDGGWTLAPEEVGETGQQYDHDGGD